MATIKTLKRILEHINKQDNVITPTQIKNDLKADYRTVIRCLNYLSENNLINIITNGNITLISKIK